MPSFFYHLALDLETVPSSYLDSRPNFWEAFQTSRGSTSRRGQTRKLSGTQKATSEEQEQNKLSPTTGHLAGAGGEEDSGLGSAPSGAHDWRYGKVLSQGIRMATISKDATSEAPPENTTLLSNGISAGPGGLATKGRFEPSNSEEEEVGWGVIRLYRDGQETPGLYDEPTTGKGSKASRPVQRKEGGEQPAFKDEDCTTLCILAVPSYLTPSDFLGFVGEKTRDEVSHFRLIKTERSNRYMVLMKFRNGRKAREWRRAWNGKAFDGMEVHLPFPIPPDIVANDRLTSPKPPTSSSSPLSPFSLPPPPPPSQPLTQP